MKNASKLFVAIVAISTMAFTNLQDNDRKQIHVVIDAGHGGKDFGATFGGITEKEIVGQISNKIKLQNQNANVIINFTRTEDDLPTLEQRTEFINQLKPDLVLSLHVNQNLNYESSGLRLYIANENTNNDRSVAFARKLVDTFTKNHAIKTREVEKAPFHILKKSNVPAILIELGYISNEIDRKWLTDDSEQTRIADTILEFIGAI